MKLLFLDRDGVINRFPGKGLYVTSQEQFQFIPGSIQAIADLTKNGYEIVVVSNQGCVSRGLISLDALQAMTDRMLSDIRRAGGNIARVMYCVHQTSDRCNCKKPKTQLFYDALGPRVIAWKDTFFVGDSMEDMEAAQNLGCGKILVLSGRTQAEDLDDFPVKPDRVCADLLEASQWVQSIKKS